MLVERMESQKAELLDFVKELEGQDANIARVMVKITKKRSTLRGIETKAQEFQQRLHTSYTTKDQSLLQLLPEVDAFMTLTRRDFPLLGQPGDAGL